MVAVAGVVDAVPATGLPELVVAGVVVGLGVEPLEVVVGGPDGKADGTAPVLRPLTGPPPLEVVAELSGDVPGARVGTPVAALVGQGVTVSKGLG